MVSTGYIAEMDTARAAAAAMRWRREEYIVLRKEVDIREIGARTDVRGRSDGAEAEASRGHELAAATASFDDGNDNGNDGNEASAGTEPTSRARRKTTRRASRIFEVWTLAVDFPINSF